MNQKNFFHRSINRVLHLFARFLPGSTSLRPLLHRLRGVKIHGRVFIGDDVYLENECPECVEIHEGAVIGIRTMIIAHTRGEGRIIIERDVMIGAGCILTAAKGKTLTIGQGAVIGAGSIITRSIAPGIFCAGAKTVPLKRATVALTLNNSYEDFVSGLRDL